MIDVQKILRDLQESQYREVAGARASVTLPVSDRLVSRLIAESLPATAPLREVDVRASAGNRFSVRVRLTRPVLLPPITVNLAIEQQPQLPERPILVIRLLSTGILSFAGMAMRFLNVLPPGIRMDGDLVFIDLRTLLEQQGLAAHLNHLEAAAVTTDEGRFVVELRGGIPG